MSTSQAPRRRADLRPRSRRPARVVGTVLAVLLVAIAAAAAWMLWNGLQARDQLLEALPAVQRLQGEITGGDPEAAAATLADLQAGTSDARDRTDGPLWAAAGALPLVGDDVSAATAAIEVADDVARRALPPAVEASGALDPAALQPKDGRIALEPIQQAAPLVRTAADEMVRAAQAASGIDVDGVDPRIAGPVTDLRDQLAEVAHLAATAADAVEVLPGMLGADGPRSYLLLFQNNAEVRATGGLPGSFAVITADQGQIALAQQASTAEFTKFEEPVLEVPPEVLALHGENLVTRISDINLDPHFPLTAQLAREMWAQRFGQQVDGVVSTDPVALSYLLEAAGPVPLATGDQLTAENAVRLLLAEVYARYEDFRAQDAFFASAAAASFEALVSGQSDPRVMVEQLARAADEGRVLVWSAHETEQAAISGTVLEGALPTGEAAQDAVGVYLNDGTRSKLSYYLDTSVAVAPCAGRDDQWSVSITMSSSAPPDAGDVLPDYVLGEGGRSELPAGVIRTQVLVYAPAGGAVTSVRRGAEQVPVSSHVVSDRHVVSLFVDLAPGESVTYEVGVARPGGVAGLHLRSTPGVHEAVTTERSTTCDAS